jgi:hypothetical protein
MLSASLGIRFTAYASKLPQSATLLWQSIRGGRRGDRLVKADTVRLTANTA